MQIKNLNGEIILDLPGIDSLSGANLRLANLYGADLSGADLSGADLRWANLYGANLSGADLRWANLRWADLSGADLSGADLSGANLYGADLSGADLSGADLSGADLRWANLRTAIIAEDTHLIGDRPILQIDPIGSREDILLAFVTDKGLFLKAGCFFGTDKEFAAKLKLTHGGMKTPHFEEYMAAIALCRKHFKLWKEQT